MYVRCRFRHLILLLFANIRFLIHLKCIVFFVAHKNYSIRVHFPHANDRKENTDTHSYTHNRTLWIATIKFFYPDFIHRTSD